jgi:hypothetical protein
MAVFLMAFTSCAGDAPAGTPTNPNGETQTELSPIDADLVVNVNGAGQPIDPRLFGTNVPAWLGREAMTAEWLLDAIERAGITSLRMPGGSWSNGYDWLACELGEDGCIWSGAARPSDFAALLNASGLLGMWTVSINHTAQSAAALVAYFNGSVGDDSVIGIDRNGDDWATVAIWAQLRVDAGFPDPVRIEMWEIGNEVFGGSPDSGGSECAEFGWEGVWTCDGATYMVGDDSHDGYLAIRAAMLQVDPTIEVGAVGVADPESWSNWGNEVIDAAGDEIDFYVVHQYGFDRSESADAVADRPGDLWPDLVDQARLALPDGVDIALTEYNLVSFETGDTNQTMTRAVNALYLADTLGYLAMSGVPVANQWNIANGRTESGTDYGLIDVATFEEYPAFAAFESWASAGSVLLEQAVSELDDDVRVYPTLREDGAAVLIAINSGAGTADVRIALTGMGDSVAAVTSWFADDPDATVMERESTTVPVHGGLVELVLPGWSITTVLVEADV